MKSRVHSISPHFLRKGRTLLMIFLSFFLLFKGYAQKGEPVTVRGKVSLGGNTADLSGTSVQMKGAGKGVATDAGGNYTIAAKNGGTLVFSRIGFKTIEMKLESGGKQEVVFNVTLEQADNNLDQVVVVSYGKQNKRDITGAVVKVSANDVQDVPAAEFGQKLQGKVAGLQASMTSGIPGQGMAFRIRGAASLSSGNQPLIVVDGQPIISDVGSGDANLISPDEIESFSVLKDAAATALYGSRASNGVIIITTKQAKIGRTAVTANAYYGLQKVTNRGRPNLMNAREFATFMKGFYEDKIKYEKGGVGTVPVEYQNPDQYGAGTDWYRAILRTAPIQDYAVNISSGNDKISSSTTLSYFDQQGVLYNTGMRRFTLRSNNEYRPIDRIKIGLNLAPSYQLDHNTRGGNLSINGNRAIVSGAEISSPLIPVYNADGTYTQVVTSPGMLSQPNFLQQLMIMRNDQSNFHMLANAYLDVEPLKGLHIRSSINGDLGTQDFNAYYGTLFGTNGKPGPQPLSSATAFNSSNNSYSWLNENLVTYTRSVNDHNFDVLGGYTIQKFGMNYRSILGTGFANDNIPWISGATVTTGTSNKTVWTVLSALARVNYDYKKRYYLSATIRNDASSRFGMNKKYATFPSVSAGWVVSDEAFFPENRAVSFLKLKGSYGLTGNNNLGNGNQNNYPAITLLNPNNYVFDGTTTPGQAINLLGNPDLSWETSKQTDVGIELSLLKNRITFSYDYYNKKTENMLSTLPIPYASGYGTIAYNVGVLRMWGHEFSVSTKNLTGELTWTTDVNVSLNKNKIISLVNHTPIGGTNYYNDVNRTAEGHSIGELYGFIYDGIYKDAADLAKNARAQFSNIGTSKMRNVNGDDTIDIKDRTFLGNPTPTYVYGITNTFTYKNFDLSIIAAGQGGNRIMNTNLQNFQNLDGAFNLDKDMMNRWRSPENPGNGKVPRTLANTTELYRLGNSNWVYPGDFLAIRNIALGYTLHQASLRYIKSIRVYASVQNAFIFTRYPGQNPEANDNRDNMTLAGQDNGSNPIPRTVMIGANIHF